MTDSSAPTPPNSSTAPAPTPPSPASPPPPPTSQPDQPSTPSFTPEPAPSITTPSPTAPEPELPSLTPNTSPTPAQLPADKPLMPPPLSVSPSTPAPGAELPTPSLTPPLSTLPSTEPLTPPPSLQPDPMTTPSLTPQPTPAPLSPTPLTPTLTPSPSPLEASMPMPSLTPPSSSPPASLPTEPATPPAPPAVPPPQAPAGDTPNPQVNPVTPSTPDSTPDKPKSKKRTKSIIAGVFFLALASAGTIAALAFFNQPQQLTTDAAVSFTTPACPIKQGANTTVVQFNNVMLKSNKTIDQAKSAPQSISLLPGTYKVSLVQFDPSHPNAATQLKEAYSIQINGESGKLASTFATTDLLDKDSVSTTVTDSKLVLKDIATSITAMHAGYPDKNSNNDIVPVCAAFELLAEPTPTPSLTPVPISPQLNPLCNKACTTETDCADDTDALTCFQGVCRDRTNPEDLVCNLYADTPSASSSASPGSSPSATPVPIPGIGNFLD